MLDGDKKVVVGALFICHVSKLIGTLSFEIIPAK
jgi:hypothetical protein